MGADLDGCGGNAAALPGRPLSGTIGRRQRKRPTARAGGGPPIVHRKQRFVRWSGAPGQEGGAADRRYPGALGLATPASPGTRRKDAGECAQSKP
jgi:hypothetical protein